MQSANLLQPKLNENQLKYIRSQPAALSVLLNHLHAFRSLDYQDFLKATVGLYKSVSPVYPVWKLPLDCFNVQIKFAKHSAQ